MKRKYKYLILVFSLIVFSCGPKKGIVTKKKRHNNTNTKVVLNENDSPDTNTDTDIITVKDAVKNSNSLSSTDNYILQYAAIAQEEMRKYKIPASITLAQGILESGSGRGRLSVEANNHFGIKCHGWKGAKIYHDDDSSQECFRKYSRAEFSYEDHSKFLTGRKRYAALFQLRPNDYKGWAKGLRAAGYATDRKYPQKLISLIERYKLYRYDDEILGKPDVIDTLTERNSVIKHVVVKGDTLYSLSKYYRTTVEAIKSQNNLESNDLKIGQELIIIN